jgi:hypothetical protein
MKNDNSENMIFKDTDMSVKLTACKCIGGGVIPVMGCGGPYGCETSRLPG